jgi:hypothetical protein
LVQNIPKRKHFSDGSNVLARLSKFTDADQNKLAVIKTPLIFESPSVIILRENGDISIFPFFPEAGFLQFIRFTNHKSQITNHKSQITLSLDSCTLLWQFDSLFNQAL